MSDFVSHIEIFQSLVRQLVGITVSLPWEGYGSAIFLELGKLAPLNSQRQHYNEGEACIAVEWDWRIEVGTKILCGSSNSSPEIEAGILALRGSTIQSLSLVGQVPELVVQFSNDYYLRSMAMVTGDPQWSIKLPKGKWIYVENGKLLIGKGIPTVSKEEEDTYALAGRTASRWGIPVAKPKLGSCAKCTHFVHVDGEGALLDYGACIADAGPFDGHIVNSESGCPSFNDRTKT